MTKEELADVMASIEGYRTKAYKCTAGYWSVGFGFNMEKPGAKDDWDRLGCKEDFDKVIAQSEEIGFETAMLLLEDFWDNYCVPAAKRRCEQLGEDYDSLPEWHKFILADIVYNIGNINGWTQVIKQKEPHDVLFQSRRKPKDVMDSRVSKIGYAFGLISSIEEAHEIGIEHAKYLK